MAHLLGHRDMGKVHALYTCMCVSRWLSRTIDVIPSWSLNHVRHVKYEEQLMVNSVILIVGYVFDTIFFSSYFILLVTLLLK